MMAFPSAPMLCRHRHLVANRASPAVGRASPVADRASPVVDRVVDAYSPLYRLVIDHTADHEVVDC